MVFYSTDEGSQAHLLQIVVPIPKGNDAGPGGWLLLRTSWGCIASGNHKQAISLLVSKWQDV